CDGAGIGNADLGLHPTECCSDESCEAEPVADMCVDSGCGETGHHDNSLCEWQRPRLTIFEDLIQNVHRNLEQPGGVVGDTVGEVPFKAIDGLQFHIHFPHHCHQDPPRNPGEGAPVGPGFHLHADGDHSMHQSCFHARLPLPNHKGQPGPTYGQQQAQLQQDYDFFVQFNNFRQLFPEPGLKMADLELPAGLKEALHVDTVRPPHTFLCQWENCLQPVDNESLMDHVLGTHLAQELLGPGAPAPGKLECEWDDCGFMDGDVQLFLDHLNSHKSGGAMEHGCVETLHGNVACTHKHPVHKLDGGRLGPQNSHALRILDMRISPKRVVAPEPSDPLHTCKWQTGTSAAGEPILCNRTHASAGALQDHLKDDHIGRGKLIYHCCWHGCERNNGKPFTQRQKIFRHIHVHTGHRPCVCATCGASFAVPSLLKLHQRIHLGEKPYACATCGRCFATRSSRAIHMRIHSDSRPLVCTWPGCGKRFRESTNLTKHMRTHTRTFTCEQCGKDFDTRRGLTRHMKSH
ncbi:hypothetical protein METBIDRAFT_21684, partial [Metschnikowia bicuspidata var. bicuspidata NRRL YB-4993]